MAQGIEMMSKESSSRRVGNMMYHHSSARILDAIWNAVQNLVATLDTGSVAILDQIKLQTPHRRSEYSE